MGKKKIEQPLARAGLHLGVTTVGRMRKEPPAPAPASASVAPASATAAPATPSAGPLDAVTKRRMVTIISAQCLLMLSFLTFSNGFMQMFLQKKLELSSVDALFLVSLPSVMLTILTIPGAYFSDRYGKLRIGLLGNLFALLGLGLLCASGVVALTAVGAVSKLLATGGVIAMGAGWALYGSNWYALLQPIIPERVRGRFFGTLRVSWQLLSIAAFSAVTALLQATDNRLASFLGVLVVLTVMVALRIPVYLRIPELEQERVPAGRLFATIREIMHQPGYMPFCSYLFLLYLFIGAAPWIFPMLEGDVLNYAPDRVVLFGTLMFVGQVIGFLAGGWMVDRFGTRMMFVLCHLGFGTILAGFVLRGFAPVPLSVWIGTLRLLFGVGLGASSIAITSEILALLPERNKSLATALVITLEMAGMGLSGVLAAKVVAWHVLADHWTLGGTLLSPYDTLILGSSVMVVLLTVTLGLVPSVIGRARWMPQ